MLDWQLSPHFLIRSAGFPFAWLEALACEEATTAVDRLLDAEESLDAKAEELVSRWQAYPKVLGLKRQSLIKTLSTYHGFSPDRIELACTVPELARDMQDWNDAVAELAPLETALEDATTKNLTRARVALFSTFEEPRIREAVFLSSPSMYRNTLKRLPNLCAGRNSQARRTERQLALYLQRFCAKNETTSFFGPINYGSIGSGPEDSRSPVSYDIAKDGERRMAFMAFWAVQALADAAAMCQSVRSGLVPRLASACRLTSDGSLWIGTRNRTVKLNAAQHRVLEKIAEGVTLEMLIEADGSGDRTEEVLHSILQKRLVELSLPVPVQEIDALGWLARSLAARDDGSDTDLSVLRHGIDKLSTLRDRFAQSETVEKARCLKEAGALFEALTGRSSTQRAGQIYADRTLFYEEATGNLRNVVLTADAADKLQARLAPLLDLWALAGVQRMRFLVGLGARIYKELYGDCDESVFLVRFLHDVVRDNRLPEWEAIAKSYHSPVEQLFVERLKRDAIWRRDADGIKTIDLSPDLVREICQEALDWTGAERHPFICTPDLLLERCPDGSYRWVLGEVHDTAMVWGWALALHPEAPTLQEDMWRYLSAIVDRSCTNVAGRTRIKIVPFNYPGSTLTLSAAATEDATDPIALSEVVVRCGDGTVWLEHDGRPLVLYNGELPSLLHQIFALPRAVPFAIHGGPGVQTPRVTMGDFVLQRASWQVNRASLGLENGSAPNASALLKALGRARRALGLPKRVFARIPDQPKPVYVDLRSLHSAEILDALMPEQGNARMTEVIPDGDALWLDPGTEAHHTAEFRITVASPPLQRGDARDHDKEDLRRAAT